MSTLSQVALMVIFFFFTILSVSQVILLASVYRNASSDPIKKMLKKSPDHCIKPYSTLFKDAARIALFYFAIDNFYLNLIMLVGYIALIKTVYIISNDAACIAFCKQNHGK